MGGATESISIRWSYGRAYIAALVTVTWERCRRQPHIGLNCWLIDFLIPASKTLKKVTFFADVTKSLVFVAEALPTALSFLWGWKAAVERTWMNLISWHPHFLGSKLWLNKTLHVSNLTKSQCNSKLGSSSKTQVSILSDPALSHCWALTFTS